MSVWISAIRTKGLKRVIFINLPYVRTCKIVYKKWYSIVLLSCKDTPMDIYLHSINIVIQGTSLLPYCLISKRITLYERSQ